MKNRNRSGREPLSQLESEVRALRLELRQTLRAYGARLEVQLAEIAAAISNYDSTSRDRLHEIRDVTIELGKRKLKPDRGRRKDLRKIDALIEELHAVLHPATR